MKSEKRLLAEAIDRQCKVCCQESHPGAGENGGCGNRSGWSCEHQLSENTGLWKATQHYLIADYIYSNCLSSKRDMDTADLLYPINILKENRKMKIAENILSILAECRMEENTLYLPERQLDRKTYEAVNNCLVAIGGRCNRNAKRYIFDYDPQEAFENLILTGETEDMKKIFQFFPTPCPVAEIICDLAELVNGQSILELSCAKDDLADFIYERAPEHLVCIEIYKDMKKYLDEKPYPCMVGIDFLAYKPEKIRPFDRIVMNQPFSRQQDIDHIYHAFGLLKSRGILVSVLSPSPFFRTNEKSIQFRKWLQFLDAEIIDVPEGAFKEIGTMIRTKIIKFVKP